MNKIVEFLRAQLNRDEQIAREAVAGPWTARDGSIEGGEHPNNGDFGEVHVLPYAPNEYDPDENTAAHIARYDPVRVLAEVEAKRRIIAWVLEQQVPNSTIGDDFAFPLYALAQPYADQPGYRDEWRP